MAQHAERFTELTWPTNPPPGLRSRAEVPGVLYPYLRKLVLQQRGEQAEQRKLETIKRLAVRQAEAERLQVERVRLKEEAGKAQQVRLDQVREGIKRGSTNREIGANLGVSLGIVEKLKRAVRGGEAWDRNSEERASRLNRAREALRLQTEGLSRPEICQRMSLSPATVKMLLGDAKFYSDPTSDPARLTLAYGAAVARRHGIVRSKFQTDQGLTKPKSTEAWKDADVLEPSDALNDD